MRGSRVTIILTSLSKVKTFFLIDIKSTFNLEPIEQNVHGNKGVYELVYFMKESKSLERFRKQAQEFDKLIEGKSDDEIERLVSGCLQILLQVSLFISVYSSFSSGRLSNTVPQFMGLTSPDHSLTLTYHGI